MFIVRGRHDSLITTSWNIIKSYESMIPRPYRGIVMGLCAPFVRKVGTVVSHGCLAVAGCRNRASTSCAGANHLPVTISRRLIYYKTPHSSISHHGRYSAVKVANHLLRVSFSQPSRLKATRKSMYICRTSPLEPGFLRADLRLDQAGSFQAPVYIVD